MSTNNASTSSRKNTEHTLTYLEVASIHQAGDFNPRTSRDTEKDTELTASIKARGLKQPILVRPDGEQTYLVTAGARRLACAIKAGLKRIPAVVCDDNNDEDDALIDAVTENTARHDLNPLEEARAFQRLLDGKIGTQKELGHQLGKPASYISERLRPLRLPEHAQNAIAAGEVPLSAARALEKMAKVSPIVADGCVALVEAGHVDPARLNDDPAGVVGRLSRVEWKDEIPLAVDTSFPHDPARLALGDEGASLVERYRAITGTSNYYYGGLSLTAHVDDARAFDCLLEYSGRGAGRATMFICDRQFVVDRLSIEMDALEKRVRERANNGDRAAANGEKTADELKARRAEREQQQEEAVAARSANLDLGRDIAERFHAPKLDKRLARLLVLLVIDGLGAGELGGRGLRYVDPKLQDTDVRTLKSGETREKTRFADRHAAAEHLMGRLDRARTPGEMIGVLVQALVATHLADEQAVPKSHRIGFRLPGVYGWYDGDQPSYIRMRQEIPALIEELARPALPARMAEALEARDAAARDAA